jgi:hypothetical protein
MNALSPTHMAAPAASPYRRQVCGCEISADETPCEGLEYGYKCGIALLKEGGCQMSAPKVVTSYWPKPIPISKFDWSATTDDYDLGSPVGFGATEEEAINDLILQLGENRR